MIRLAIIDPFFAMRAGLSSLLDPEPDIVVVGSAGTREEIHPLLYRVRPDAVIIAGDAGGVDGVDVARAIKAHPPAPIVVLYPPTATPELIASAILAGADGLVSREAPIRELMDVMRGSSGGNPSFPALSPAASRDLAARFVVEDQAILSMRLAGTSDADIGEALRIDPASLRRRIGAMLDVLRARAQDEFRPASPRDRSAHAGTTTRRDRVISRHLTTDETTSALVGGVRAPLLELSRGGAHPWGVGDSG